MYAEEIVESSAAMTDAQSDEVDVAVEDAMGPADATEPVDALGPEESPTEVDQIALVGADGRRRV